MSSAATVRAVIMAGGEGTRLRPFTHTIPKPLLPIGRKPVAQIIVERLRECAFSDIVFSLQYGGDLIRAFFQNGRQFGVAIRYYTEPRKLGTAGCLAHIPELRGRAIFSLVLYNLMFIIPLIVVFILAFYGTTSRQLTEFLRKHAAAVKLGMAALFIALAAWLVRSLLV